MAYIVGWLIMSIHKWYGVWQFEMGCPVRRYSGCLEGRGASGMRLAKNKYSKRRP
jgi:hypothetical protein